MSIMRHSVDLMKSLLLVAVKVCNARSGLSFFATRCCLKNFRFESLSLASTTRTTDYGLFRSYTYGQLCFMASHDSITVCLGIGRCNCSNLVHAGTSDANWSVAIAEHLSIILLLFFRFALLFRILI